MTKFLYFCVDEDSTECVFADCKPSMSKKWIDKKRYWFSKKVNPMELPNGSIKHILGFTISWANKPIKWSPFTPHTAAGDIV